MPLLSTLLTLSCIAYGPAQSRESLLKYKFLQEIRLTQGALETTSVNELSQFEAWRFMLTENRTADCPGSLIAQSTAGELAALKGLYTGPNGTSLGIFLFDDAQGERFKALIECPQVLNPDCHSPGEALSPWEIF